MGRGEDEERWYCARINPPTPFKGGAMNLQSQRSLHFNTTDFISNFVTNHRDRIIMTPPLKGVGGL